MANRSKQKGDRAERAIVELLRSYGLEAYRVPLSGAVNGFKDDIEIRLASEELRLESKVRGKGFGRIYKWLTGSDGLIIKADREPALIVMDLHKFTRLLATTQHNRTEKAASKPIAQPLPDSGLKKGYTASGYGAYPGEAIRAYDVVINGKLSKPV